MPSHYLHRHPPQSQILPPLRLLGSCLPPSFLLLKRKPPRQTGLIPASFTPLPNLSIIQQTNPAEKYPKKGHSTLQVLPLQQTTPAQKHPTKGRPGLQVLPLAARRIPLSSLAAWTCTISFHLSSNPQASCSQAARLQVGLRHHLHTLCLEPWLLTSVSLPQIPAILAKVTSPLPASGIPGKPQAYLSPLNSFSSI